MGKDDGMLVHERHKTIFYVRGLFHLPAFLRCTFSSSLSTLYSECHSYVESRDKCDRNKCNKAKAPAPMRVCCVMSVDEDDSSMAVMASLNLSSAK
jgi:hypothetical protein